MYDFSLVLMIAQHAQKVSLIIRVPLMEFKNSIRIPENIYHSCGSSERCQNSINGSGLMTTSSDIQRPCLILALLVSVVKKYLVARFTLLSGLEHFNEAMLYVEQHQLYDDALKIWRDTDQYKVT